MKIKCLSTGAPGGSAAPAPRSGALTRLWLLSALLVSAFGISSARAAQQVEIYNLSLRFESSTTADEDGAARLELTTGSRIAPANGELALAQGTINFTHAGHMFLTEPASGTTYYSISLNIPTDDLNGDGMFDILEQEAVTAVRTTGTYTNDDLVTRSILATWNKAAGSHTGICALEFPDAGLTFTAQFENIHYSGTYDHTTSGSRLTGPLMASRNGVESSTLAGPLDLEILSGSMLGWGLGEWLTESGGAITYEGSDLDRNAEFEYSAFFVADDGDLSTAIPDYQTWFLVLPNIPDANGNGTPDLAEAEGGVRIALRMNGTALTLDVTGAAGGVYDLETRSSLSATDAWSTVGTYSFDTDSESIPVTRPATGNAFWRLR